MRSVFVVALCVLPSLGALQAAAQQASPNSNAELDRGRYVVKIAGCNDCHTPNWPQTAGAVPEAEWLTGSSVGFQGPWGTTYPANLRLAVNVMTEAQWMAMARQPMKPPMPWFALRDMTDADLRAIYRLIKALGPAGKPAPHYVPPGGNATTPVIAWPGPPPKPASGASG